MRRFFNQRARTTKPGKSVGHTRRSACGAVPCMEPLESRQLMSVVAYTPPVAVNGDPIALKYQALGGVKGILGKAITPELPTEFLGGAVLTGPQPTPYTGPLYQ